MTWAADIDASGARVVCARFTLRDNLHVIGGEDAAGVEQIRARVAAVAVREGVAEARELTRDELVLACVMASEDGNGNAATICMIGDATVNRAARAGQSIWVTATAGKGLGRGKAGRPMTTAIGPRVRHVRAAIALLRHGARGPRGIARGAFMWIDPKTQDTMHAKGDPSHCSALTILERWCWNRAWANRPTCTLGPRRAPSLEWVGPVEGVEPYRLMAFRTATADHARLFAAAEQVIRGRGAFDVRAFLSTAGAVVAGVALAVSL